MTVTAWVLAGALLLAGAPGSNQRLAESKLKEGQELLREERFEQAVEAFREALRLDPLLMMAHYGLGQAHMALREYPAAVADYQRAREVFLQLVSVGVSRRLGDDQARDDRIRDLQERIRETLAQPYPANSSAARRQETLIQQWELEIATLQRSQGQTNTPEVPAGLSLRLGSAHFRNGQMADAEREYRAAIAVNGKLGEAHNNLAVVLLLTGRAAEAKEEVRLAEKAGFKVPPGLVADIDSALATAPSPPRR